MSDVTLEVRVAAIEAFISQLITQTREHGDFAPMQATLDELNRTAAGNPDGRYAQALRLSDASGEDPTED